MKKLIQILSLIGLSSLLFSCFEEKPEVLLTFHVASPRTALVGDYYEDITMPISGMKLKIKKDHFMFISDLKGVDWAQVSSPDGAPILGMQFYCDSRGANRLYQETAGNRGAQIVMMENGVPVGVRPIDAILSDGRLFVITEFHPDTNMDEKIELYRKSIKAAQEMRNKLW